MRPPTSFSGLGPFPLFLPHASLPTAVNISQALAFKMRTSSSPSPKLQSVCLCLSDLTASCTRLCRPGSEDLLLFLAQISPCLTVPPQAVNATLECPRNQDLSLLTNSLSTLFDLPALRRRCRTCVRSRYGCGHTFETHCHPSNSCPRAFVIIIIVLDDLTRCCVFASSAMHRRVTLAHVDKTRRSRGILNHARTQIALYRKTELAKIFAAKTRQDAWSQKHSETK